MATKKDTAQATTARALVDLPAHGVRCGGLVQADPATIADLVATGAADHHPDAVAAARAQDSQE